jgi:hypothetical protein
LHETASKNAGSGQHIDGGNTKSRGENVHGDCSMIVRFFDRQDEKNSLNGSTFADSSSMLECFRLLSSRPPFFCEIEGENSFKLLVGVGGKWSCIQHGALDGSPPYLMAVAREPQLVVQDLEFLIGSTPTPIHRRCILSAELAENLISFFIRTGKKSELVEWEEI